MQNASVDLTAIRQLTQEERLTAMQRARAAIVQSIGGRPDERAYASSQNERMTRTDIGIWVLCIVVLVAAFSISAIRLFHIGRETFLHSINDANSAVVAAIGIVILAETTQIVTTLALARVGQMQTRRMLLLTGIGATAVAIIGNLQIVTPWSMHGTFTFLPLAFQNPFSWLEALFPPSAVLVMAHVLKHQLLDAENARQQRKHAFEKAVTAWESAMSADPEKHPEWGQFYANALRDAIRAKNARISVVRDALPALTKADWRALVHREIDAEDWYEAPALPAPVTLQEAFALPADQPVHVTIEDAPRKHAANNSGQTTDEITAVMNAAIEDADGVHVHCPYCNREFVKPTHTAARLALTAHFRGCTARKIDTTKDALVKANL